MSEKKCANYNDAKGSGRPYYFLFPLLTVLPLLILGIFIYLSPTGITEILLLSAATIAVFFISFFICRRMLKAFDNISLCTSRIARGNFYRAQCLENEKLTENICGHLNCRMKSLDEITAVVEAIAVGDLSRSVRTHSEQDKLAISINRMEERLREVVNQAERIASGDLAFKIKPKSGKDIMAGVLQKMTAFLKKNAWLKDGVAGLNNCMRGKPAIPELSGNIIRFLTSWLNAEVGLIYIMNEDDMLMLTASCGPAKEKEFSTLVKPGDGLAGNAVLENKIAVISNIPGNIIKIRTGIGEIIPQNIIVIPFSYEERVTGVIEIASMHEMTEIHSEFLEQTRESIGIAINSAESREKMEELLGKTQQQAEELQAQQEELRVTNEELEERTRALQEQKLNIQQKNLDLQKARNEIEKKAEELELSSKYKSEFLANMSHELRTPLNSILILSKLLSDKNAGNLKKKQREFAQTIHDAGSDLLSLINEILDLSKIEAGMMEIRVDKINLDVFIKNIKRVFMPVAANKSLDLVVKINKKSLPAYIYTDSHRFQQVVNNLLSNAFKFTEKGSVTMRIVRPGEDVDLSCSGLSRENAIAISVTDTGIGIPMSKHDAVFEAFQQKNGTIARKYGGTGLGLAISKELALLLGGEIQLDSRSGEGSTFTLYLPEKLEEAEGTQPGGGVFQAIRGISPFVDRRKNMIDRRKNQNDRRLKDDGTIPETGDRRMGEDDRRKSFEERRRKPDSDAPPNKTNSLEIPDDRREIQAGDKSLLIIESDPVLSKLFINQAQEKGFKCVIAGDGKTGVHFADFYRPSAILMGTEPTDIRSEEVKERLKKNPDTSDIPIHFLPNGDREPSAEIALLLHRVEKELPEKQKQTLQINFNREAVMAGKKILIVDDDMRNVFALTSILEEKGMKVIVGANGEKGLEKLNDQPDVDLVLMDIMMPVMDGYEAMNRIRREEQYKNLPIIALTAKAMKGDRNKCISAGANDYLAKPVEADKLISLMKVWLDK